MSTAPARLHHPLGPSQWPAWSECSDFENEPDIEDIDDVEASAIAVESGEVPASAEDKTPRGRGRLQHAATAALLMRQGVDEAMSFLTEREKTDVQWVATKTEETAEAHGWSASEIRCEDRITMVGPDMRVMYFGTRDAWVGPLRFEWKYGLERNYFPQLVGYSLPDLEEAGGGRFIGITIYGMLRRVRQSVIDLKTAQTVGYGILRRRTADVRPPKPCQYCGLCRKKLTCSAVTQMVTQLADRREDWPTDVLRLDQAHVSRMTTDPVMLGKARWLWKYYLEKWGASVEWASKAMAEAGVAPVGFSISPRKGSKGIANAHRAVEVLKGHGLPGPALEATLDASFGALAKVLAKHEAISEEKAKTRLETLLREAGLLTVGPAGVTLRAEADGLAKLGQSTAKGVPA